MANSRSASKKEKRSRKDLTPLDMDRSVICGRFGFEVSEAYKLLRTNLEFTVIDKKCKIIGVTSAGKGETKSTTAINLAYTIAQTGQNVLLIDGDLRLPTVAKRMQVNQVPGLSDLLVGHNNLEEVLKPSGVFENWFILPSGNVPPNPSELLGSAGMDTLFERLSGHFDYIIIDLPPISIVSDAIVISKSIDGLILVVRERYSSIKEVEKTVDRLETLDVKILGFVLTDAHDRSKGAYGKSGKYGNYGNYAYGYAPRQNKTK